MRVFQIMKRLSSEISFFNARIFQQFLGIALHGNLTGFQYISTVCGLQCQESILFNQQDTCSSFIDFFNDAEYIQNFQLEAFPELSYTTLTTISSVLSGLIILILVLTFAWLRTKAIKE